MDRQKEKMLENMEKNKQRDSMASRGQLERIKRREEELIQKKQMKVQSKMQEELLQKKKQDAFLEPSSLGEKFKEKVESKLFKETKAMADKKRTKYDSDKDGPGRDAHTMGGNILGF